MAMGRTYVPLTASSADMPSVLNASGGGQVAGSYWLNWETSGFTGISWFWDEENYNYPIPTWWNTHYQGNNEYVTNTGYSNDENGFKAWIATENPVDLNFVLGNWTNGKLDFAINNHLYNTDCFTSN